MGCVYLPPYALIKERKNILKVDGRSFLVMLASATIGGGLSFVLGYMGLKLSTAINFAFLCQTSVVFSVIMAYYMLKEPLNRNKIVLILILVSGSYLVSTSGKLIIPGIGDIYILLATLLFSFGVITTRIAVRKITPILYAVYRSFFSGVFVILLLIPTGKFSFDIQWFWVAIVGMFIAVGTIAMGKTLEVASASYLNMMQMSIPVLTAVLAFFFLGETMNLIQMLGATIIVVSGIFVQRQEA